MGEYSTTTLTMARHFNVPSERVYDAWLTPEIMKKWLFTLEATNQKATNNPHEGGTWEIIDRREGKDYRAIGDLVIDRPKKLMFTFKMPQFSETVDHITVVFEPLENGCDMTFSQEIIVPHEENWTAEDIEKALTEFHDRSEYGWNLMFIGLKQLVEQGFISPETNV